MLSDQPEKSALSDEVQPILASLKGIVSVTMGLAITHAIVGLVTRETYTRATVTHSHETVSFSAKTLDLSALSPWSIVCTMAVVASIIRFYHGNNRFMQKNYGAEQGDTSERIGGAEQTDATKRAEFTPGRGRAPRGGLAIDFLVVFLQSVMFALISFYAIPRRELLLLFGVLLLFDIFWVVTTFQAGRDPDAERYHRRWMWNNLLFGFLIGVSYVGCLLHKDAVGWPRVGVVLIAANTFVDFYISRDLYFLS